VASRSKLLKPSSVEEFLQQFSFLRRLLHCMQPKRRETKL
jgi:hypothetical protein